MNSRSEFLETIRKVESLLTQDGYQPLLCSETKATETLLEIRTLTDELQDYVDADLASFEIAFPKYWHSPACKAKADKARKASKAIFEFRRRVRILEESCSPPITLMKRRIMPKLSFISTCDLLKLRKLYDQEDVVEPDAEHPGFYKLREVNNREDGLSDGTGGPDENLRIIPQASQVEPRQGNTPPSTPNG